MTRVVIVSRSMAAAVRQSWTAWLISEPFEQQQNGAADGVMEQRCYITCPDCGEHMNVAYATAMKNRSLHARQHLRTSKAHGASSDAGSQADASIYAPPSSKRVRSVDGAGNPTSIALQERIQCLERMVVEKNDALSSKDEIIEQGKQCVLTHSESETRLVKCNVELTSRVHSLETQMQQMCIDMQQMRSEMQQLRPLVPIVERIGKELNLSVNVPPAPSIDVYISRLDGLKKAAAVSKITGSASHNHADVDALQKQIKKLNRENKDAKTLAACFREFPKHPVEARTLLRSVAAKAHPDKHGGAETVPGKLATGFQSALNILMCDLPP